MGSQRSDGNGDQAQTLKSNKVLIICIGGRKNCDAEMPRQPELVRAIKTEMASEEG